MPRQPHTEQRPWWPEALEFFEKCAAAGLTRNEAALAASERFEVTRNTFYLVMERGSVPAYPTSDPARAAAWKAGEISYLGAPCPKHETRERYSNDGNCVQCMAEYARRHYAKGGPKRDSLA